uniref:Envelope protein n=1 Tax=Buteo japonicus TaxID=224669 RepID=A0A8C0BM46_9AVES
MRTEGKGNKGDVKERRKERRGIGTYCRFAPSQRLLTTICLGMVLVIVTYSHPVYSHGHRPFKWTLIQLESSKTIQTKTVQGAPQFNITYCGIFRRQKDPCYPTQVYLCPSSNPGRPHCNYPGYYFCGHWGCETLATAWTPPVPDKYLKIEWGPPKCTSYYIVLNPEDPGWVLGRTWGMMSWTTGKVMGTLIQIKKEMAPSEELSPVGPNTILTGELGTKQIKTELVVNETQDVADNTNSLNGQRDIEPNSLWKLMEVSYQVLNQTNPNLTDHCWLCFDTKPPYYEAIGIGNSFKLTNGSNPPQCNWENGTQGISMQQIMGKGKCVGRIPIEKQHLCLNPNGQIRIQRPAQWLIPTNNAKWVCSKTGITSCISLEYLQSTKEFCVQIMIVPRIIYHSESYSSKLKEAMNSVSLEHYLVKREPITALTLATLMVLGSAGAGTGIASLVKQNQDFTSLRVAVDEDLMRIEQSITALETSIRSLSEVVLQNRRGLDLLFLKEGGLCAALREECCVYADHTGVVRDTMTKLREGLEKRQRERESRQNWYEAMFNYSPWLTTLISTIAGPLLLLVLGLTFGPCIFNKLISIVKGRLEAAHLLFLKSVCDQFHAVHLLLSEHILRGEWDYTQSFCLKLR